MVEGRYDPQHDTGSWQRMGEWVHCCLLLCLVVGVDGCMVKADGYSGGRSQYTIQVLLSNSSVQASP
jgi:hypothetical protein